MDEARAGPALSFLACRALLFDRYHYTPLGCPAAHGGVPQPRRLQRLERLPRHRG